MKPERAPQQQPSAAVSRPPGAGTSKAAPSGADNPKRGAADGGKKKKPPADPNEKLSKSNPSVEPGQGAAEERDKEAAPEGMGFVATLLTLNPLNFVPLPSMKRVDSLEVIRKRLHEKEEPPAPFPLEKIIGGCLTVLLVVVLVAYVGIGISAQETTTSSADTTTRTPGFDKTTNDTLDDAGLQLLDTASYDSEELEELSLPAATKDVNGSGPATDAAADTEVEPAGLANGSAAAPF